MVNGSKKEEELTDLASRLRKKYDLKEKPEGQLGDEFSAPSEAEEITQEKLSEQVRGLEPETPKQDLPVEEPVKVSVSSKTTAPPEDVKVSVTQTVSEEAPAEKIQEAQQPEPKTIEPIATDSEERLESSIEESTIIPETREESIESKLENSVEELPKEEPKPEPAPEIVLEPAPQKPPVTPTPSPVYKPSPFDFIKEHKLIFIIGGIAVIGLILIFLIVVPMLTTPSYQADLQPVSAGVGFQTEFTTNDASIDTVTFEFVHASGETEEYPASKQDNTWFVNDVNLLRSGDWTLRVTSRGRILYSSSFTLSDSCSSAADCEGLLCCYGACISPECSRNNDCADEDACTIETCSNAGTCEASCSYQRITEFKTGDSCCPRGATKEQDLDCTTCETGKIYCSGSCITPVCNKNSDCDDGNYETYDICYDGGTCNARCESSSGGCSPGELLCNNRCTIPKCSSNAQCNDNNTSTNDTCLNPGTCNAVCSYMGASCTIDSQCTSGMKCCNGLCKKPACSVYTECDDNNPLTTDYCDNPNTCIASCRNTACTITCSNDIVCGSGKKCYNPGTCTSFCAYCTQNSECTSGKICCNGDCITPACTSDSQCSFGQACTNPGTCDAVCGTTTCSNYRDCVSGRTCCSGACTALTCGEQYWSSIGLNQSLIIGGNNVSMIQLLSNNTADNSVIVHVFDSTGDLHNARHTLPYSSQFSDKGFNFTVIDYDDNINNGTILWSTFCQSGTYCKNYNTCNSACVECLVDENCATGEFCNEDNVCVAPACSATLEERGSVLDPTTHLIKGSNYLYFANDSRIMYYDGFVRYLPSLPKTISLYYSDNLYKITYDGHLNYYTGSIWSAMTPSLGEEPTVSSFLINETYRYIGLNNGTYYVYNTKDYTLSSFNGMSGVLVDFEDFNNLIVVLTLNGDIYYYENDELKESLITDNTLTYDLEVFGSKLYATLGDKIMVTSDLLTWSESGNFESFGSIITLLSEVDSKLFAGDSEGRVFVLEDNEWQIIIDETILGVSNKILGVKEYSNGLIILNEGYGLYKYVPENCDGYCLNNGTAEATCLT
ncbi:MAG: hypothetical protein JW791_04590 [Nanoarchaeota archaeon]|nr:hypothetical protein [Nanoarchaeota archaeon]